MNFAESLRQIQQERNSLLCIGLDPDPGKLPPHLGVSPQAVLEFNRIVIEATSDLVCAYKLNLAFYEALGDDGWGVIRKTVEAVPGDVLTIGDAKRGDIGNTAERSAAALFGDLKFSAVTVNAYMGRDSVAPYLQYRGRGVFLLALTSNPGSRDFQRLKTGDKPLFERVVRAAKQWDEGGAIGLVVGATHPKELKRVRSLVPTMPLLIPGVGQQGGDLRQVVRHGCDRKGFSAVVNVGRSIIFASRERDFASAVRREALKMRDEMRMIQAERPGG